MKRNKTLYNRKLSYRYRPLFLIDTVYNACYLLLLIPLFQIAIEFVMDLSELSYITSENFLSFLSSPLAFLLIMIMFLITMIFLLIKLSSLIFYCNVRDKLRKPYFPQIFFFGILNVIRTIRKRYLSLLFIMVPYYIYTSLPVIIGFILHTDFDFTRNTKDEFLLKGLLIFLFLLFSLLAIRSVFEVNYCMSKECGLSEAHRQVSEILKSNYYRIILSYVKNNFIIFIGYLLFYYLILLIVSIAVYFFTNRSLAVAVFLSSYPKINIYSTLFFSMITFIYNINLSTSMMRTYIPESIDNTYGEITLPNSPFLNRIKKQTILTNSLLLIILVISLFNFYMTIRNDSLFLSKFLTGTKISSHRGYSNVAPENTLPALEHAILAASDYAEIDVQQTKDGILVLAHDSKLKRTAGLNKYLWEMTYPELVQLDVGLWFGDDFLNTKIPTLEEVLILCKGKISLNIEIKIHGKEQEIEQQLISLIEQYGYENQCVISSRNYPALVKIKQLNEEIKTGYILSAVYGNFYNKENIDFFSIKSDFVTRKVVESAHQSGKEVYVWTVNSPREMLRMESIGVDCIITDTPVLAREVLYRDDTNDTFVQLIKQMFQSRSLYRLSQFIQ